jgi:hypothetical protein
MASSDAARRICGAPYSAAVGGGENLASSLQAGDLGVEEC